MTAFSLSLLPVCLLSAGLLAPASAADFTVSTGADSGAGSLRQAILDANAAPGPDVILFTLDPALTSGSVHQITVTGALPDITDALTIAGIYQVGTTTSAAVEIRSTGLAAGQSILTVTSGTTTLRNLNLVSFTAGTVGLTLTGGGANLLEGLRVGITAANQIASAALHGIVVASDDNTITGCRVGGASGGDGIRITGSGNQIKSGILGLKAGASPAERRAPNRIGIHLLGGSHNVIGGGTSSSTESNQISANSVSGIHIEGGTGHSIEGNRVTSDNYFSFGENILGNGTGTSGYGIRIDGGASEILVMEAKVDSSNGTNIAVIGPAANVRIANVQIVGGTRHGISVGAAVTDLTIEDSFIGFMTGTGIHLEGGIIPSGPVLIRDNRIENNDLAIDVAAGMGQVTIGTRRQGGPSVSNQIFGNWNGCVLVRDPAARVRISENAIRPNVAFPPTNSIATIPINLKPSGEPNGTATSNDPLDADAGPNGLQNKPVITAVEAMSGTTITVTATLHAKPTTAYVIEALQHIPTGPAAPNESGYLGSATVTTDASGNAPISMQVSGYTAGWKAALTATSPEGETSEYSNAEAAGFTAPPVPRFPLLNEQTSFSLPENASETGSAYSLLRPMGTTGAFNASISANPGYARDFTNPAPRPPLKYRFSPTAAWTNLDWSTTLFIPFSATEHQRVIYLAAFDDTSWDPANKPGKLSVYPGPGSPPTSGNGVPLVFPDNDPPPVFTATYRGVLDGITTAIFENVQLFTEIFLTADRTVSASVDFTITLNAGQSTAIPDQDFFILGLPRYTSLSEGETILHALEVDPLDDTLVEGDEVISVNVVSTTAGITYSAVVPLTLKDNDFYQTSIADATVAEGHSGTKILTFPITLSQPRPAAVAFDWTAAPGTALSPSDFTAASGTVTIPAGSTSASIQVVVNGDTAVESDENFTLTLSNPTATDVRLADASAVGTISNDDFPAVSLAGLTVSEAVGTISLTARLSEAAPFAASVDFTLINGSAINTRDFTGSVTGTLNFPAGSTTAFISVGIVNDTIVERDETFTVQLSSPSSLTLPGSAATITIQDNDSPSLRAPLVILIVEGDTGSQTIPVTLTLSTAAIRAGSVNWQVSAASTAVEAASGTVTFAPGVTTASLDLTLPGDLIPHTKRLVSLVLSSPIEVNLPVTEIVVAAVSDNDQRTVTGSAVTLAEGNGGTTLAQFPISITAPLAVPVTVDYQTVNGTALAGSDFTAASGTATIPAGATSTTIPVSLLTDNTLELDETFSLRLSAPVNATVDSTALTATITNDDAPPTLLAAPSTVTASPGGPVSAWIKVAFPETVTDLPVPVAYRVNTRDGSALAGIHYSPLTGRTLTFPAGNGVPVPQWITVSVAGTQAGTVSNPSFFQVDFTNVSGPATTVSTQVRIEPLRITDFSRLGLGFYTVSFPTGVEQTYVIQQAASLLGPWSDKSSVITGTGNPVEEFLLFSTQPRAYFRIRSFTRPPIPVVVEPWAVRFKLD